MPIRQLEPKSLWNAFADLNAIPRPSKREERIRTFMMDFGKSLGLETLQDAIGNVIIKKPATSGMEGRETVILQSHLDMVHQKNETTVFNFDLEGIKMQVHGDWVAALGTTLGADNGIGVAAIMAILASKELSHPSIEALFTIDEETGMTGAKELDGSFLQGKILLNLDTEDDDELSIGCAGGIDTNTYYSYQETSIHTGWDVLKIKLRGLLGGHSGMDIDKGRGNANKWMARILWELTQQTSMQLISFDGGSLRNAIPREATCRIAVADIALATSILNQSIANIQEEYKNIEPEHNFEIEHVVSSGDAMSGNDCIKVLNVLCSVHNGVFRVSPEISDLVEASSSLARVIIHEGNFTTQSLQRSSVESTKAEVSMAIRASFENMGANVEQSGDYPGWQPNRKSRILHLMENIYIEMFHEKPQIKACHAGLECGILGKHLPNVEMISFGPNIRAAHSPDEKVQISSVQKFWSYLLETLKQIPLKS